MLSEQLTDELEAIAAIYPECITTINETLIDLKIPGHEEFKIRVSFPEDYPEKEIPHILQVWSSGHDDRYLEGLFNEVLQSVFREGSVCIFDFLTEMEGILYVEEEPEQELVVEEVDPVNTDHLAGWSISEPAIDRGSTFVAFAAIVQSEKEASEMLHSLKSDRKIRRSNHNMVAYRIQNEDGTRVSDCDDDGEAAAGGRILHLLTIMDAWNVIVVVSRWFGGVHIGPDRFKHINSTAREAVISSGCVDLEDSKKSNKKKKSS